MVTYLAFPHGKFDHKEYLHETIKFPEYCDFWNDLKQKITLSEADYAVSKQFYLDQECKNLADYLLCYNKRDVAPFKDAIVKHIFQLGGDTPTLVTF